MPQLTINITDNQLLQIKQGLGEFTLSDPPQAKKVDAPKEDTTTKSRPVPDGIKYGFVKYPDGRDSICSIPDGYVQTALSDADYEALANEYGLEVALVKAVVQVESGKSGFLLNESAPSRPKILFEAHWFFKFTPIEISKQRPDLSSAKWNRSLYKGSSAEWDRLLDAMAFDEVQAMKSASWGLGQVMGMNYKIAGCDSIKQFVEEAFTSEYHQARHMMNFIVSNNLLDEIRNKDWHSFARTYNGPSYKQNGYHTKLAQAYQSFV